MRVYLADLGHNQITKSSDSYPLGVANLASYLIEYLRTDYPPHITIFREPEDLKAALDATTPDVLGVSSYSWNHQLSLAFARYAKRKDAGTVTMMGGPNFPLTPGEQETFLRSMTGIDIAVRGPTAELLSGELGGNLLSKYSMIGRFYVTQDSVDFLEIAIGSALGEHLTAARREELATVSGYLRCVLLRVPFRSTMQRTDTFTAMYGIEAWRAAQEGQPLSAFRTLEPSPGTRR